MKYLIKTIITLIILWGNKVYEHNVTIYESQMATNQLDNDSSYMVSRFFAEGTGEYAFALCVVVIALLWYSDINKLIKLIIKKIKESK